jgi:hypothetical protein
MALLLECRVGLQGTFWFTVNHWHSSLSAVSGTDLTTLHRYLWWELDGFFQNEGRMEADAMIVIGDFNCEPGDQPLINQPGTVLTTTRERHLVVDRRGVPRFLYNPMWRFMGEEHSFEETREEGYGGSRPLGTYLDSGPGGWRMIDQIFITRDFLVGPQFRFVERTLRIAAPEEKCSDHSAIGVAFEIEEGA